MTAFAPEIFCKMLHVDGNFPVENFPVESHFPCGTHVELCGHVELCYTPRGSDRRRTSVKTISVYLSDEEVEFVKDQPKGFLRELLAERILQGADAPEGLVPMTVYLTPEELAYVREREQKNGPGWFSRVAQVNMRSASEGRPPFWWLLPEGLDSESLDDWEQHVPEEEEQP